MVGRGRHSTFTTNPDMLVEQLHGQGLADGRVYHPVRSRDGCKGALASRLTARIGFLGNSADMLSYFDDDDIEDVVRMAGETLRRKMRNVRRAGRDARGAG